MSFLRTLFFIVLGWYLLKWLARWIAGGSREEGRRRNGKMEEDYDSLTDQEIDDADYEDL